jgi:hypothetical protein
MIGDAEKTQAMQGAVSGTGTGGKSPLLRSRRDTFSEVSEVRHGNLAFFVFSCRVVFMI